jgi:hypothetical protein
MPEHGNQQNVFSLMEGIGDTEAGAGDIFITAFFITAFAFGR